MHNSLFIRDLLKAANNDPAHRARRDPHRQLQRDVLATPASGEFELTGEWTVRCAAEPTVAQLIERDCCEFLGALGLSSVGTLVADATAAATATDAATDAGEIYIVAPAIVFALDGSLPARACRLQLAPQHITVSGGDVAGLWAGLAWLEWEMRTRRGPFLPVGDFVHEAAWPVQISQGPYGGNYSVPDFAPEYLSDDAFRLYAHYGVNSMMIYGDMLCYVQSAIFPELNLPEAATNLATLRDAATRAARYGVQFSYVVVGPKLRADHPLFERLPSTRGSGRAVEGAGTVHCLCSGDPQVTAFYDEFFSGLFSAVPQLAGAICIIGGESFYHCRMWPSPDTPCPVCSARSTETVVADLMGVVQRAVAGAQPAAFVAAWPYNTSSWERPDRLQLVRQLPPGVALYQAIEKDQCYRKDGYNKLIWDYSIDCTGPSDNLCEVASAACATAHPLFIKTETGIGLEVIQFPYVPALHHLTDKWQAVRDLQPQGVQQSWLFFGMFGSRAEELALWAAYRPDLGRDQFLQRMAERDFGPAAAPHALSSWQLMSEAVRHLPCVCLSYYYVGPGFLGPAHPLVPERGTAIPDIFSAYFFYLLEDEETFSLKSLQETRRSMVMHELPADAGALQMQWEGPGDGWDIVMREYAAAAAAAEGAWQALLAARAYTITEADLANLQEELVLTELFYRTMLTCLNTVTFLWQRREFERSGQAAAMQAMREIARGERANAAAAAPLYRAAPWLDLHERIDGRFASCISMIEEKVRMIDRFLQED